MVKQIMVSRYSISSKHRTPIILPAVPGVAWRHQGPLGGNNFGIYFWTISIIMDIILQFLGIRLLINDQQGTTNQQPTAIDLGNSPFWYLGKSSGTTSPGTQLVPSWTKHCFMAQAQLRRKSQRCTTSGLMLPGMGHGQRFQQGMFSTTVLALSQANTSSKSWNKSLFVPDILIHAMLFCCFISHMIVLRTRFIQRLLPIVTLLFLQLADV